MRTRMTSRQESFKTDKVCPVFAREMAPEPLLAQEVISRNEQCVEREWLTLVENYEQAWGVPVPDEESNMMMARQGPAGRANLVRLIALRVLEYYNSPLFSGLVKGCAWDAYIQKWTKNDSHK